MMKFIFFLVLVGNFAYSHDAGVGRGGGGSGDEKLLRQRFIDVVLRAEHLNTIIKNSEVGKLVVAIRTTLKNHPLKIEFPKVLRYCDTLEIISEKKDAWGCPGLLQILPSFDVDDDSMIFHELTRITPGFEFSDEGMRISVEILNLNTKNQKYTVTSEKYSKNKFSRQMVEREAKLRELAGAEAVSVKEDANKFALKTFWKVLQNGPVESSFEIER